MNSYENDVIVAGGGAAGFIAAVAASRNGAKVLLVEQANCLGGVTTAAGLCLWGPFDNGKKRIIKGIPEEFYQKVIALNGAVDIASGFIPVNPEAVKYAADEMIKASRTNVLFHSFVVDVMKDKAGQPNGVVVANKSGLKEIHGKVVVDATGDGDVAVKAGASFQKGRDKDGKTQPMTLCFRIGGVDLERYLKWREEESPRHGRQCSKLVALARRKGELTFFQEMIHAAEPIPGMESVVAVNMTRMMGDATDMEQLSKAETEGRRQAREAGDFFVKYIKGFEKSYILDTAFNMGVRETRRIEGEYVLTKEDVLNARKFDDAIAANAYCIDLHSPSAEDEQVSVSLPPGTHYTIPYRCLIPKKVKNVIITGRCISVTHEALASTRIQPCCMALGQAAGTAAALSIKENVPPHELSVKILKETLLAQGALLC